MPSLTWTLSLDEAAGLLGLGRHTVRQLAKLGRIPVIQVGKRQRVPVAALEQLLLEDPEALSLPEGPSGRGRPEEGRP